MEAREQAFLEYVQDGGLVETDDWMPDEYRARLIKFIEMHGNSELMGVLPERDWILSRVIWLGGTEDGRNRGGDVDTLSRYVYIHGTPDSEGIGVPRSHGCIRMRNADVVELFDLLEPGMAVQIDE